MRIASCMRLRYPRDMRVAAIAIVMSVVVGRPALSLADEQSMTQSLSPVIHQQGQALTAALSEEKSLHYRLLYGGDEAGGYQFTLSRRGQCLAVRADFTITVRLLGIPVYQARHSRHELWRGGVLRRMVGTSSYNGTRYQTSLRLVSPPRYRLAANGVEQDIAGPLISVMPLRPKALEQATLVTAKGKQRAVQVMPAGKEMIELGGMRRQAYRYDISGDITRTLWYDKDGWLLAIAFEKNGTPVRFGRTTSQTAALEERLFRLPALDEGSCAVSGEVTDQKAQPGDEALQQPGNSGSLKSKPLGGGIKRREIGERGQQMGGSDA